MHVAASAPDAFAAIRRIGGRSGWYSARTLWSLRGALDWFVGGPGLRRGRRDPDGVRIGDTIDFWRVEGFEPDHLLRLRAEMKLPGRAWLQLEVEPDDAGSTITQTALFDPDGVAGLAYWYLIWPIHRRIFASMLRGIAGASALPRCSLRSTEAVGRVPANRPWRTTRVAAPAEQAAHVRGTG